MKPLPFAPLEMLMLLDDRDSHPMVFQIECVFTGTVCRERFEQAVALVVGRHPLLTARVQFIRGYPHWILDPRGPTINWTMAAAPPLDRDQFAISLDHTSGCCVDVFQTDARLHARFRFFHACCDGIAAGALLGEVLSVYHALSIGADWQKSVIQVDPELLRHRANFRRGRAAAPAVDSARKKGFPWREIAAMGLEGAKLALSSPATVTPSAERGSLAGQAAREIPYATYTCDDHEAERIHETARALGIGVNDLMIAALFRTLADWNRSHGKTSARNLLRILMPTNMRQAEDRAMPAANVMSYAFLDRRLGECDDVASLAQSLHVATHAVQRFNLSRQFVDGLAIGTPLPWLYRMVLNRRTSLSTAVLSTIGDPSRRLKGGVPQDGRSFICGDLCLEAIYGVPPIRPRTHLSVGINRYKRLLHIGALADVHTLSTADARELIARLMDAAMTARAPFARVSQPVSAGA